MSLCGGARGGGPRVWVGPTEGYWWGILMIIIFGLQQKLMVNVNAQVKKLMCGNE
jgi:biotin transporter BioY